MTHFLLELASKHSLRFGFGVHEPLRITNQIEIYQFDRTSYCLALPRGDLEKILIKRYRAVIHQEGDEEVVLKFPWETRWDDIIKLIKG